MLAIQDKVYNAVKAVAEKSGYAVIFDRAGDMTMLYANAKNDKSDDVLELMGYKGGKSSTGTKKQ